MFENKKIFVLGMARSGYAVAKLLSSYNNQILVTDQKEQDISHVKELENLGVNVKITKDPLELFDDSYDYVIKNPGIRFDHPICLKAQEYNIPVTNEVEAAYSFLPKDVNIISVTGSNGKTTTTTLIYELLKEGGLSAHLGGNIGIPVSELVLSVKSGDTLVLEISGHQQHDFINYKTNIAVMTNLSPVHLDFFGDYETYKKNKSIILKTCDLAILNGDNKDVLEVSSEVEHKYYFGKNRECELKDNFIYYMGTPCVNVNNIKLKGMHNYENIMASILVVKEFNISDEVINNFLENFGGVEHRIEFVKEINGREFYNDSKSTNCVSTITALKTFKTPVILLLGGLDRGHSFDELKPYMDNVKQVISFGETGKRINEWCVSNNYPCITFDVLDDVVKEAYKLSKEGDTILLSPACASWDQYKDFEERGRIYKKLVERIGEEYE